MVHRREDQVKGNGYGHDEEEDGNYSVDEQIRHLGKYLLFECNLGHRTQYQHCALGRVENQMVVSLFMDIGSHFP